MKLRLGQVDAFTNHVFAGNPVAVVPLESWLPDRTLQAIAMENNLSETAYFVRESEGYRLARRRALGGASRAAGAFGGMCGAVPGRRDRALKPPEITPSASAVVPSRAERAAD